jgi:hypothetical protein
MSDSPAAEAVELDVEEDAEVYVSDPEDYLRNQRLKAIHNAKKEVRKARKAASEATTNKESQVAQKRLVAAVSTYGAEILPLVEEGVQRGLINDEDLSTTVRTVKEFVVNQGRMTNPEWEEAREEERGRLADDGTIICRRSTSGSADSFPGLSNQEGNRFDAPEIKQIKKRKLATVETCMIIYQDLSRVQRKLGAGLELEEQTGPAKL